MESDWEDVCLKCIDIVLDSERSASGTLRVSSVENHGCEN